ncbi:uncharacterized protein LY89DRAFT_716084 [Mollisia scopiformis]|uniref:Uncharacterized protein n=1 Tax=Mollisia scopiformis TaxID=149040 RepID=A0A194XKY1_MOLSC|nr:uncharacterized protein LY89DRAFT_716084 [Mollisia scopiformis]KUJ20754.1 hypothetical protein LY89DRAFT_716084 [Mollisia scopiformis]
MAQNPAPNPNRFCLQRPRQEDDVRNCHRHYRYLDGVRPGFVLEIERTKEEWAIGEMVSFIPSVPRNQNETYGEYRNYNYTMKLEPDQTRIKVFRESKGTGPSSTEVAYVYLDESQGFRGWFNVGDHNADHSAQHPHQPDPKIVLSTEPARCETCGFYSSWRWRDTDLRVGPYFGRDYCQNSCCRLRRVPADDSEDEE